MVRANIWQVGLLLVMSAGANAGDGQHFRSEALPECTVAATKAELPQGAEIRIRVKGDPAMLIGKGLLIGQRAANGLMAQPSGINEVSGENRVAAGWGTYKPGTLTADQVIRYKITKAGRYGLLMFSPTSVCVSGAEITATAEYDEIVLGSGLQLDVKIVKPDF